MKRILKGLMLIVVLFAVFAAFHMLFISQAWLSQNTYESRDKYLDTEEGYSNVFICKENEFFHMIDCPLLGDKVQKYHLQSIPDGYVSCPECDPLQYD